MSFFRVQEFGKQWAQLVVMGNWSSLVYIECLLSCFACSESDLWGYECSSERSLLTAPLFPVLHPSQTLGVGAVLWFLSPRDQNTHHHLQLWRSSWRMSWQQIRQHRDQERTLQARRELFFSQAQDKVQRILLGREERSLMPIIRAAVLEGAHNKLLDTLDTGKTSTLI